MNDSWSLLSTLFIFYGFVDVDIVIFYIAPLLLLYIPFLLYTATAAQQFPWGKIKHYPRNQTIDTSVCKMNKNPLLGRQRTKTHRQFKLLTSSELKHIFLSVYILFYCFMHPLPPVLFSQVNFICIAQNYRLVAEGITVYTACDTLSFGAQTQGKNEQKYL